jgi:hypothetical protein
MSTPSVGTAYGTTTPPPAEPVAPSTPPPQSGWVSPSSSATPLDGLKLPSSFPVGSIQSIGTPTGAGQVFRLDGGFLDALRLVVRKIKTTDGNPGYQLDFKIAGPSRQEFMQRMEQKGATKQTFEFLGADATTVGSNTVLARNTNKQPINSSFYSHAAPGTTSGGQAFVMEGSGWRIDYVPNDGPIAMRGHVRLQLFGDDAAANKALKDAGDKLGLQAVFAPPTQTSIRRYALMKLLWRVAPQKAKELASEGILNDLKVSKVEDALKAAGVSDQRMNSLKYLEVAPGHFTVCDDQLIEEMKQKGLRYAYSTVTSPEHVLSILKGGQKATLSRWTEGMLVSGMSSMADLGSGGAQGVFSRLVTENANGTSWAGRTYKIILKPKLLGRMDVWGWPADYYGRSWDLTDRNFGPKLVEDVNNNGYKQYNEIISPVGNGAQYISCIVATNENDRTKLIEHLKQQGWSHPGGKSIEEFVRLAPTIDANLLG